MPSLISLALGIGLMALLARIRFRLKRTTLAAPFSWAIASIGCLLLVETLIAMSVLSSDFAIQRMRFVAATSIFCPMMSLLGAKRPQDRGWQFIVASLWLVLLLPMFQAFVFSSSVKIELHWAWSYFLAVLLFVGLTNHVLTRFRISAVLVALAQAILLREHLPVQVIAFDAWEIAIAMICFLLAVSSASTRQVTPAKAANPFDRLWLDFRDAFGVVWGLRIMERVNQLSAQEGWAILLTWNGFQTEPHATTASAAELEKCLRTLLRRFVCPDWIDDRLEGRDQVGPRDN